MSIHPCSKRKKKTKPEETKYIEQGNKPVKPEVVADGIINSLYSWRFFIPSDLDSFLASNIALGFSPASFREHLGHFFLGPLLRFGALFERRKHRQAVMDYHKSKKE